MLSINCIPTCSDNYWKVVHAYNSNQLFNVDFPLAGRTGKLSLKEFSPGGLLVGRVPPFANALLQGPGQITDQLLKGISGAAFTTESRLLST